MSFIEKQRHGKHSYFYLVKNVRIAPNKVKKLRVWLGREIPKHSELQRYFVELEKRAMEQYETKWLPKELVEKVDDLSASIIVFHKTPTNVLPKDFLVRYTYNSKRFLISFIGIFYCFVVLLFVGNFNYNRWEFIPK